MEWFDSRDIRYRSPFGAVAAGTPVFFRVCLPRGWGCSGCRLRVCPDGKAEERYGMFWAGMEGEDREWWDCHYAPAESGLYFYGFELDIPGGTRHLSRRADGGALCGEQPGELWQLTAYEGEYETPAWLAGGVMYQIFPDRFARSLRSRMGEGKTGVPEDRTLREDWGGQPVYQPDALGKVRNNDYFQGDLRGIEEGLDRLKELGVTCLYLNPIFEAHSNHRYDTADYERVDPLLGEEEDFRSLTETAARLGIRVILDGVFSHTGADSRYFNREGRYPGPGAYNSPASPYFPWYHFRRWPDDYVGWWGFDTLPEVEETTPGYMAYMLGEKGIVRRWLRAGAAGWRLDVADELPDAFLDGLRRAVKAEQPDALLLGEVWEDASTKRSYGHRRRYLLGRQLDSVMNYPFREAILAFLRGGAAADFMNTVMNIAEQYPPQALRLLMNHIGTHDTERAITALAGEPDGGRGRDWQAARRLSGTERRRGLALMRLATALQYCLPGVPCIYYGDEAGLEGYKDPFNRGCYPWGEEDAGLLSWYRRLGQMRRVASVLKEGGIRFLPAGNDVICLERFGEGALLCAVNRSEEDRWIPLPAAWRGRTVNLGGGTVEDARLRLPPLDCAILLAGGGEIDGEAGA